MDEQQSCRYFAGILERVRDVRRNRDRGAGSPDNGLGLASALERELVATFEHVEQLAIFVRVQRRPESGSCRDLEAEIGAVGLRGAGFVRDVVAAADEQGSALAGAPNHDLLTHFHPPLGS